VDCFSKSVNEVVDDQNVSILLSDSYGFRIKTKPFNGGSKAENPHNHKRNVGEKVEYCGNLYIFPTKPELSMANSLGTERVK